MPHPLPNLSRRSAMQALREPRAGASTVYIVVDDFAPQPYPRRAFYPHNRVGGDRGALNDSLLRAAPGALTCRVAPGRQWGGLWTSLNHPLHEQLAVDFSAIFPAPIAEAHQGQISGLRVRVRRATPGRTLRVELRHGENIVWSAQGRLTGGPQTLAFRLPALRQVSELRVLLEDAAGGDEVTLQEIALRAASPTADPAWAAFAWSYGMLLANWSERVGLARDRAYSPAGSFDAVQATGALAAATAQAAQLGLLVRADAAAIVGRIGEALLRDLPRYRGLWPHFTHASGPGGLAIVPRTEWSTVDTSIAALSLLAAQGALGLETAPCERFLREIDWSRLLARGCIAHGYTERGRRLASGWDTFGGESWLVGWAYASARGKAPSLCRPQPPTDNGAGFIDEMAWLLAPPPARDCWGADWAAYRAQAARAQLAYYRSHPRYGPLGLFGLSAAEAPAPWAAPPGHSYQAFGVGGRACDARDGGDCLGAPVIVPHEAALLAVHEPQAAVGLWAWLMRRGLFTPWNNVESLMLYDAGEGAAPDETVQWNDLRGSWNLSLQTLGWGRYLAQARGETPILWRACHENAFLRRGYDLLAGVPVPQLPGVAQPSVSVPAVAAGGES